MTKNQKKGIDRQGCEWSSDIVNRKGGSMTVLDDAISLEERARAYYEEAQQRVTDSSAKKILNLLTEEEKGHATALTEMKSGTYGALEESLLPKQVLGLVEGAIKEGQNAISTDASMKEILQKAMEIEQATCRFYEENATSADDDRVKELFASLAKQELGHYLIVSSLSEYFDRPAEWVESAEFGLRPEY
jgi:rubrerythrin